MAKARDLSYTLGGRWHGQYGTAPCPVCQPQRRKDQNALTLAIGTDGRLLLHCKKTGCAFRDILAAAGVTVSSFGPPDQETLDMREAEHRAEIEKKSLQAQRVWQEALPIPGTAAETYLREARGITCALPPTLRFHPACWHKSAQRVPAMVGLIEGGDGIAVHRTYLRHDGSGKANLDGGDKLMLGPARGGAVRLARANGPIVVGEGIETTLSALVLQGNKKASAWAALSTSGMAMLRLPSQPGELILAPDGDKAGRGSAFALADRAVRDGWTVFILTPPKGGDFNDILMNEVAK